MKNANSSGSSEGKPDSEASTSVEPQVEPSRQHCVFCGSREHLSGDHPRIPGPSPTPNYFSCCGARIQRSVGGAISYGPHAEDCPIGKVAADSVSHPPLEQDILDCAWRITARCGISHDCIPFIKEELDTLVRERSKRA